MKNLESDYFQSPSLGRLTFAQMGEVIENYILSEPEKSYRIIIGTDSAGQDKGGFEFATAILIHRVGRGGIYFWQRNKLKEKRLSILRQRIWQEAVFSIEAAEKFLALSRKITRLVPQSLEIHIDVGEGGPTKEMIAELVGFVRANGFEPRVKPEAYGASKVADRHV